jgi:hypothetical protein
MNLQQLTDVQLGDEIELEMRIIESPSFSWAVKHNQYELLKAYWREEARRTYGR